LRGERIFSIDPETAKDIDDALSVTVNENGTYDVGVHIADVSFFVKPNTPLDRDARKRATSVYLVQRAVPMLPPALSEQLCSLLPGQDRLAFSVIFTMDIEGKVVKKWFGKTIIRYGSIHINTEVTLMSNHRSVAKLSYSDAQRVIDGQSLGNLSTDPAQNPSSIEHDINLLQSLAKKVRNQRFQNGTLSLESLTLSFKLGEDGFPIDCGQYERSEANTLIEEVCRLFSQNSSLLRIPLVSSCCWSTLQSLSKLLFIFQNKHCYADMIHQLSADW